MPLVLTVYEWRGSLGNRAVITTPSGERIEITLSRAGAEKAQIGIQAPRGFQIHREGIHDEQKGRDGATG